MKLALWVRGQKLNQSKVEATKSFQQKACSDFKISRFPRKYIRKISQQVVTQLAIIHHFIKLFLLAFHIEEQQIPMRTYLRAILKKFFWGKHFPVWDEKICIKFPFYLWSKLKKIFIFIVWVSFSRNGEGKSSQCSLLCSSQPGIRWADLGESIKFYDFLSLGVAKKRENLLRSSLGCDREIRYLVPKYPKNGKALTWWKNIQRLWMEKAGVDPFSFMK